LGDPPSEGESKGMAFSPPNSPASGAIPILLSPVAISNLKLKKTKVKWKMGVSPILVWLVVSTQLKTSSQIGNLPQMMNIKNI